MALQRHRQQICHGSGQREQVRPWRRLCSERLLLGKSRSQRCPLEVLTADQILRLCDSSSGVVPWWTLTDGSHANLGHTYRRRRHPPITPSSVNRTQSLCESRTRERATTTATSTTRDPLKHGPQYASGRSDGALSSGRFYQVGPSLCRRIASLGADSTCRCAGNACGEVTCPGQDNKRPLDTLTFGCRIILLT
jgi:hypothetical protein